LARIWYINSLRCSDAQEENILITKKTSLSLAMSGGHALWTFSSDHIQSHLPACVLLCLNFFMPASQISKMTCQNVFCDFSMRLSFLQENSHWDSSLGIKHSVVYLWSIFAASNIRLTLKYVLCNYTHTSLPQYVLMFGNMP
jgi:hypothetical protein